MQNNVNDKYGEKKCQLKEGINTAWLSHLSK